MSLHMSVESHRIYTSPHHHKSSASTPSSPHLLEQRDQVRLVLRQGFVRVYLADVLAGRGEVHVVHLPPAREAFPPVCNACVARTLLSATVTTFRLFLCLL